ncbi:MAG: NAD-dependent epimerase/dehydratase family protein [Polyangiaceae bacterium]
MNRIVVTGGTGFVGRAVVSALVGRGIRVTVLSRHVQAARARLHRGVRVVAWNPSHKGAWFDELGVVDAVIHLAGEPVAQRWTERVKARIDTSRGGATRRLVEAIAAAEKKPSLLVSASAVGIYGADRRGEKLTEDGRLLSGAATALLEPGSGGEDGIQGYFLIRAPGYRQAVALASGCPHLKYGGRIEVRRIHKFTEESS